MTMHRKEMQQMYWRPDGLRNTDSVDGSLLRLGLVQHPHGRLPGLLVEFSQQTPCFQHNV